MDEKLALHTAARRYCMGRAPGLHLSSQEKWYRDRRWIQDQELLFSWAEERGTGTQVVVLGDILFRVEQCIPEDFSTLDVLRTFLLDIAQDELPSSEGGDYEEDRERKLFQSYITSLSTQELYAIAPLPYRRVLGERELEHIWQCLEQHWGITATMRWYPLKEGALPPHVIALQEPWFAYTVPLEVLRAILMQHGVERVWELREAGMFGQYEMDRALLIPRDGGGEHCWTSERMDWMIYTSHEGSLTLCGEWLVKSIEHAWPHYKDHIYTSLYYTRPPF